MASQAWLRAVKNVKESKNVETILVGANFLDEGTHDVYIRSVDTSKLSDGRVVITFEDSDGKSFRDTMFLMNQDGAEFSYALRALFSALIPEKTALGQFLDVAESDDKAFEMFTGMKLKITLEPGKGVQGRALGDGSFAGFDIESGTQVTETYAALKDVYDFCKANGIKRSYLRNVKAAVTSKDENLAAFKLAIGTRSKTV